MSENKDKEYMLMMELKMFGIMDGVLRLDMEPLGGKFNLTELMRSRM